MSVCSCCYWVVCVAWIHQSLSFSDQLFSAKCKQLLISWFLTLFLIKSFTIVYSFLFLFFVFALLFFSKFCCCLQEDIFLLIRVKTVVVYLVVLKRRTFSHENIPQYKQIIYLLNKYGSINSNKIVIIISKSKFIDKFLFTYTLTLYWIHTYFLIFYLSRPNYCFKKVSFY